jgi:hypothetical protein
MTDREIWKQEIASRVRTVEIAATRDRKSCEHGNRRGCRSLYPSMRHRTGVFERCIAEEIHIVVEGNVSSSFKVFAFKNPQNNYWGRIDRTTIGRRYNSY